jgi:chromosome segregation ATPase
MVVSLGLWGCARRPSDNSQSERIRSLEGRCVKLEQDYRTVAQARDKARRELATLEEEAARLQREAADREALIKERDDLRKRAAENGRLSQQLTKRTSERDDLQQQLTQRISERDTVLGRYDRLRKGVQNLLSEQDAPPPPSTEGTTATPTSTAISNPS